MSSPPQRANSFSGSPRPSSPSPAKGSLKNRMQTAMRRTSTALSFKPLSRSSSKASLRDSQLKVDPALAPAASEAAHAGPSPVAESPAREAAAMEAEQLSIPAILGPSPLANVTAAQESIPELEPATERVLGQLTASPEQAPIDLPHAEPVSAPQPFGFTDPILPVTTHEPVAAPHPVFSPQVVSVPPEPESGPPEPLPQVFAPPNATPQVFTPPPEPTTQVFTPSEPVGPKAVEDRRADYFSFSDPAVVPVKEPVPEPAPIEHPVTPPRPPPAAIPAEESYHPQEVSHVHIPTDASTFAWSDEPALGRKASMSSFSEPVQHTAEPSQSGLQSGKVSTRASKSSMSSSYGQLLPNQRHGQNSSVRFSMDDPFADHFAIPPAPAVVHDSNVPKLALLPVDGGITMPEPITEPHAKVDDDGPMQESPTPVSMPLPPMQNVVGSQSDRQPPAPFSLGERDGASLAESVHLDTDERIPLLQHAAPLPHVGKAKTGPSRGKTTHIVATFASGPITAEMATAQTIHTLGWEEYVLPDSSFYYHHAAWRVTTDIDLRNPRFLQHVTEYLEKKLPRDTSIPPPQAWELWLRSAKMTKNDLHPTQSWVNHKLRIITSEPPPTVSGSGLLIERFTEDDKLDMEYRYWGFIEGHPAHVPLPSDTHTEAMDALKWSYTDCLLPSARPAPPPFAPQECQELMNLLRSFDAAPNNNTAVVVQTRIVSRVLLRIAQWRQIYFRPDKPLPKDAIKGVTEQRRPFRRTILDFVIGCLCLGIPFLFVSRSHHQRFDEESGLYSAGPMLMICACACLVAAVILSASVTLLSLPHLDDVPRLAGFLATAFSASSMVSAVLALFQYKAEMDRAVVYLGGEGLMVLSRRSVIFSLPLVFLAWAIAAFMTGITMYSFRGATVVNPGQISHPFAPYTHWAVVGTLGALGGMLTIAATFARR